MNKYIAVGIGLGLVSLVIMLCFFRPKTVSFTALENIDGIPFPQGPASANTLVVEPLAHTDAEVIGPAFAKQLVLTLTFIPTTAERLSVGIRENSFWLSYQPVIFYDRAESANGTEPMTASVVLPLTDKLRDRDGSVDLMFIAGRGSPEALLASRFQPDQQWELVAMQAQVQPVWPNRLETYDFIKSILRRERPL